jgi:beta-galactosidase beta subunit
VENTKRIFLIVIPQNVLLKSFEDTNYESHKFFYDIHYILEGCERMAHINIDEINHLKK